jgi:hypothetical protein
MLKDESGTTPPPNYELHFGGNALIVVNYSERSGWHLAA